MDQYNINSKVDVTGYHFCTTNTLKTFTHFKFLIITKCWPRSPFSVFSVYNVNIGFS